MPRVTFQYNESFVSHVSEIFFYKSKILDLQKSVIVLSLSERWNFEEKKFSLCVAIRLKRSEIVQLLERAGEMLWRNEHFTKITGLPSFITDEFFF